jgi:hypothetical protein
MLRTLITEDEADKVLDPLRIAFVIGFTTLIALQIVAVFKGQPFDPLSFGGAMGAFIGGTGVGLWTSSKQVSS